MPKAIKLHFQFVDNAMLFREFVRFKKLERQVKPATEQKYYRTLQCLERIVTKPFDKVSVKELQDAILQFDANERYANWTKATVRIVAKTFFKWLNLDVGWLKCPKKASLRQLPSPEELLTEEDVSKLIAVASHIRNKAIVAFLYESGVRSGEILNMKIGDVKFDDIGAIVRVDGKTGPRRLRIVFAATYMSKWIDAHPFSKDSKAAFWIGIGNTNLNKPLQYDDLRLLLLRLAKHANIMKDINPHHFRHSRATFLASHLTEQQLKVYFGWTPASNMTATYVHLSGEDIDRDLLANVYGLIEKRSAKESKLIHHICPRCKEENTAELSRCEKCSYPLGVKEVEKLVETEDVMTRLRKLEQMIIPVK